MPQQEVDEAHSRDLVAEAQVSGAKSHITASEQRIHVSQAEQARFKTLYQVRSHHRAIRWCRDEALRECRLSDSSRDGFADAGDAGGPLSENGLLRLALPVPESAVALVRLGEPVNVKVSALDRTFPGRVARFEDKVDQSTRTMKTEVDVPNASLVLVPGMYAEVDLDH